jgi:hypothetical protein
MPRRLTTLVLTVAVVAVVVTLWPRLASSRIPGNHEGYAPQQPIAYSHRLHAGELGLDCLYCHFGAETSRHAGIPPANVCMNCHRSVAATLGAKMAAREDLQAVATAAQKELERQKESGAPEAVLLGLERAAREAAAAVEAFDPASLLSTEIQKLYDHVGFDPAKGTYDAEKASGPIRWRQVHRLPDFVFFDHRSHVRAGVTCQSCHGPVETMERVRQFQNLSMGWCVNCHRDARANGVLGKPANPSLDCSACHY